MLPFVEEVYISFGISLSSPVFSVSLSTVHEIVYGEPPSSGKWSNLGQLKKIKKKIAEKKYWNSLKKSESV